MSAALCPKCATPLNLKVDSAMYICPKCGFKRPETLDEAQERIHARGERPVVPISSRSEVDFRARSLFESGQDDLWRGDRVAAIRAFEQALEVQPDFADAHLWIAKTSPDPRVQRDHLDEIIAHDPGHLEALRLLMVLKGQLTPEEAERSQMDHTPILKHSTSPIKASTTTLHCPVCGGALTVDDTNGRVVCRFCGHTESLDSERHASDGAEVFGAAMLKRRAQSVKWLVGERILHCPRCGAERTIPTGRLSTDCPFCGSTQVIQQDALASIETPDGLVPFAIAEDQAKAAIRERLKGLFDLHRDGNWATRAVMEGMYMPFWVFDALAQVSKTIFDRRTPTSRDALTGIQPYENSKFSDGLNGVAVAAVKSPSPVLTAALGPFDVSAAIAYEPKLLAKYPALLYDLDFDEASLEAQGRVSDHMRERHGQGAGRNVEVQVFTSVLQMSFTLLLMPVWVGTLYERDGDVRAALVNGQTGQVTLGKAQKPARIKSAGDHPAQP